MIKRKEAIELLNNGSHTVEVGSLGVFGKTGHGIGTFTTDSPITDYRTIYLKEIEIYVSIESIFTIDGESVDWGWKD